MQYISDKEIDAALTPVIIADALAEAFRADFIVPVRHHHSVERPDIDATLLLMPAWTGQEVLESYVGTKIVTVFPANSSRSLPSVMGTYILLDGTTGRPLAALDGARLTLWRTAAASALAARFCLRPDASRMVMVGAGALATFLIQAHASNNVLTDIALWNHNPERAEAVARKLAAEGLPVRAVRDLEAAVREADLISSATLSTEPLIHGAWLKAGVHLDCVGAFKPTMRETDDEAVRRASLFCDTRAGALIEGGDYSQPIASGVINADAVKADLYDLSQGRHRGRSSRDEITMFKSVGTAIEDLAAAILIWKLTR